MYHVYIYVRVLLLVDECCCYFVDRKLRATGRQLDHFLGRVTWRSVDDLFISNDFVGFPIYWGKWSGRLAELDGPACLAGLAWLACLARLK